MQPRYLLYFASFLPLSFTWRSVSSCVPYIGAPRLQLTSVCFKRPGNREDLDRVRVEFISWGAARHSHGPSAYFWMTYNYIT